jgi:hypothetical protein
MHARRIGCNRQIPIWALARISSNSRTTPLLTWPADNPGQVLLEGSSEHKYVGIARAFGMIRIAFSLDLPLAKSTVRLCRRRHRPRVSRKMPVAISFSNVTVNWTQLHGGYTAFQFQENGPVVTIAGTDAATAKQSITVTDIIGIKCWKNTTEWDYYEAGQSANYSGTNTVNLNGRLAHSLEYLNNDRRLLLHFRALHKCCQRCPKIAYYVHCCRCRR